MPENPFGRTGVSAICPVYIRFLSTRTTHESTNFDPDTSRARKWRLISTLLCPRMHMSNISCTMGPRSGSTSRCRGLSAPSRPFARRYPNGGAPSTNLPAARKARLRPTVRSAILARSIWAMEAQVVICSSPSGVRASKRSASERKSAPRRMISRTLASVKSVSRDHRSSLETMTRSPGRTLAMRRAISTRRSCFSAAPDSTSQKSIGSGSLLY